MRTMLGSSMAALNAQAVAYLKAGNHRDASDALKAAIERMRYSLQQSESQQKQQLQHADHADHAPQKAATSASSVESIVESRHPEGELFVVLRPAAERSSNRRNPSSFFHEDEDEEDEYDDTLQPGSGCGDDDDSISSAKISAGYNFRLFDRAFLIPSFAALSSSSSSSSSWDDSRTSCVILYNLALCHTVAWRQQASSCTTTTTTTDLDKRNNANSDLDIALKLYKMALSTLQECLDKADIETDNSVLLQLLAIFNNMGYLSSKKRSTKGNGSSSSNSSSTTSSSSAAATDGDVVSPETRHCVTAIRALLASRNCAGGMVLPSEAGRAQERTTAAPAPVTDITRGGGTGYQRDFFFFRWNLMSVLLYSKQRLLAPAA